jgi:hypothetical protein
VCWGARRAGPRGPSPAGPGLESEANRKKADPAQHPRRVGVSSSSMISLYCAVATCQGPSGLHSARAQGIGPTPAGHTVPRSGAVPAGSGTQLGPAVGCGRMCAWRAVYFVVKSSLLPPAGLPPAIGRKCADLHPPWAVSLPLRAPTGGSAPRGAAPGPRFSDPLMASSSPAWHCMRVSTGDIHRRASCQYASRDVGSALEVWPWTSVLNSLVGL